MTLPTRLGKWDKSILDLARGLKFEAGMAGQSVDVLRPIVEEWHMKAIRILGDRRWAYTWYSFVYSWRHARVPLTGDPILVAMQNVVDDPPSIPAWIKDKNLRLIYVTLLRLSEQDGGRFFVSCRKLGEMLGMSHETARSRLKVLLAAGVIEKAKAHTPSRATRYLWRGDTPGRTPDGAV
ncbi:MAG: hypothetical protein WCS52_07245 [bacterium]